MLDVSYEPTIWSCRFQYSFSCSPCRWCQGWTGRNFHGVQTFQNGTPWAGSGPVFHRNIRLLALKQRDSIRTILVEICLLIIPLYLLNKAKCLNRLLRTKSRYSLFCHHGPRLSCLRDNVCRQFSQISTSHRECWYWHKTRVNMTEGPKVATLEEAGQFGAFLWCQLILYYSYQESQLIIDHLVYNWNLKYVFASSYLIFIS